MRSIFPCVYPAAAKAVGQGIEKGKREMGDRK